MAWSIKTLGDKLGNYFYPVTRSEAVIMKDGNKLEQQGLFQFANHINANVTIGSGYNALSVGDVTIDDGVTVEVADGSTWTIV